MSEAKPNINVTPLIDVLLVLLIIFMVISPSKPAAFKAKVPAEPSPDAEKLKTHPNALIVRVNPDSTLTLNQENGLGTIAEPEVLTAELAEIFERRLRDGIYDENLSGRQDLSNEEKVQKTVFIKAPKNFSYGEVAKVVDAVKLSGANPVGLQIDALD
ncbi:MAG: biopolymer transporter ExbD [Acidobacteriota bacterium]|nr:biopolymer transporter ExbD [Acidobacteriota bacterium]